MKAEYKPEELLKKLDTSVSISTSHSNPHEAASKGKGIRNTDNIS